MSSNVIICLFSEKSKELVSLCIVITSHPVFIFRHLFYIRKLYLNVFVLNTKFLFLLKKCTRTTVWKVSYKWGNLQEQLGSFALEKLKKRIHHGYEILTFPIYLENGQSDDIQHSHWRHSMANLKIYKCIFFLFKKVRPVHPLVSHRQRNG